MKKINIKNWAMECMGILDIFKSFVISAFSVCAQRWNMKNIEDVFKKSSFNNGDICTKRKGTSLVYRH